MSGLHFSSIQRFGAAALFLCLVSSAIAAPRAVGPLSCELTVQLHDGSERSVTFWGMERDTLSLTGKTKEGEELHLLLPKRAIRAARWNDGTSLDLSLSEARCPARDSISTALPSPSPAVDPAPSTPPPAAAEVLPPSTPSPATLHITSSEEGLPIWIDDEETHYVTPAKILVDTLEHIYEVRWGVEQNLWGAQRKLKVGKNQEYHLHLPLKKVTPALSVHTSPSAAEIWLEASPRLALPSRWKTPLHLHNPPPGRYNIYLQAAGFRDTLLSYHLLLDHPTHLYVEMSPLLPHELQEQQKKFEIRELRLAGRILTWSAAPLLGGAALLFASAAENYEEAYALKEQIEGVVIARGENFYSIREENRKLVRRGDLKRTAGWTTFGVGAILLMTGATLQVAF